MLNYFKRIRAFLKSKFDLIENNQIKRNFLNALPFWVGSFICGVVAVLYAEAFAIAEMGTHYLFKNYHWSLLILTPLCFFLAWWIVVKYAPNAKGSGIPQVTAAIELVNPKYGIKVDALLSLRIIVVKFISSLIMVFGGGVIGREGPTIQISAAIFKKINDYLPEWYPKISKRNMLVTGAAAGLASAFNTPLGGIVFAIEELTKTHFSFFKSALLTGVIMAGLTSLSILGPYLYLGYPKLNDISPWIILQIIPITIFIGYASCTMSKIILSLLTYSKNLRLKSDKIIFVLSCGLLVALLGTFIDISALGSGKEIITSTLFTNAKNVEWYVPIIRYLGMIVSFSAGAAGGIFAPALSLGAAMGSFFATFLPVSPTETNLLILCGMTAYLTCITKSPFTSCILVLEMTNTHNIILYLMISALLANLVANIMMGTHSFYDHLKDQYVADILHKENAQSEK